MRFSLFHDSIQYPAYNGFPYTILLCEFCSHRTLFALPGRIPLSAEGLLQERCFLLSPAKQLSSLKDIRKQLPFCHKMFCILSMFSASEEKYSFHFSCFSVPALHSELFRIKASLDVYRATLKQHGLEFPDSVELLIQLQSLGNGGT